MWYSGKGKIVRKKNRSVVAEVASGGGAVGGIWGMPKLLCIKSRRTVRPRVNFTIYNLYRYIIYVYRFVCSLSIYICIHTHTHYRLIPHYLFFKLESKSRKIASVNMYSHFYEPWREADARKSGGILGLLLRWLYQSETKYLFFAGCALILVSGSRTYFLWHVPQVPAVALSFRFRSPDLRGESIILRLIN